MMLPLFRRLIAGGGKRSIIYVSTHRFTFVRMFAILTVLAFLARGAAATAHPSIDVVAANWHFTPSSITVEAGQTATLRFTSTSGTHGIVSDELGLAATTIGPGRFVEVSFTPHTAGTFKVHCSIFCGAGHPDMVLTVIVTGAAAATPAATPAPVTAPSPASTPAAQSTPKPAPTPKPLIDDRHYIIVMVAHDRIALQAAQLAMKIGRHPEIRTFAKTLAARKTAAIAMLKKWYAAWYGSAVPSLSSPMSVASLAGAPDFDRALIVAAIQQDAADATLSLGAEQGLTHPELRAYARSSAAEMFAFIQTGWRWYSSWYPVK
jgi:cytochrome c oxidase subunit II